MERKNTILLTVIAIATLLVAVVGATFAYFTATFTPTNKDNNTVNATTKTFVNTTFDYGDSLTASDVVPGRKFLKVMTITGQGEAGAQSAKIRLTINSTIPAEMKDDIKYTLYKETGISTKDAVTCTESTVVPSIQSANGEGVVETRYVDTMTCTPKETATPVTSHKDVVLTSGSAKTLDITVDYNTKDTYYLVVEYVNKEDSKQDAQNKTFTVTLNATPVAD